MEFDLFERVCEARRKKQRPLSLNVEELRVTLTYPLESPVTLSVPARGLTLSGLLVAIRKRYEEIFRTQTPKTWGHELGNLFFEGLAIDDAGIVSVRLGS